MFRYCKQNKIKYKKNYILPLIYRVQEEKEK